MLVQQRCWFAVLKSQEVRVGTIQGLSRRNNPVDPWRWNPENHVLACFRVYKWLFSTEAIPSMEISRCTGKGCLDG
eukprot:3075087-Pyramimonas_sp.AAC.1